MGSQRSHPVAVVEYWKALTGGEKRGPLAAFGRAGLRLVSASVWLGVHANLAVYQWGLLRQVKVKRPVIAVGNLTLGGTGKTTATVYLARKLAEAGFKAGIILRGHGRKKGPSCLLVSDSERVLVSEAEAGDEALLLAALLPGHPVGVGVRREQVAGLILSRTDVAAFVLDDAFQYFRLAREADIVLLDASHHIEHDRMFPAGTLREPHDHLRRATQIWITHSELVSSARTRELRDWLTLMVPDKPVVMTRHRPIGLRSLTGHSAPPAGATVVAMSGLGNPCSFEAGLTSLGYKVVPCRFPDHHRYMRADWARVRETVEAKRTEGVVITEKDAVKLSTPPKDIGPIYVLGCEMEVVDGHEHVKALIESVSSCQDR